MSLIQKGIFLQGRGIKNPKLIGMRVSLGLGFFFIMLAIAFADCTRAEICLSNQHAVQGRFFSAINTRNDTILNEVSIRGLGNDSLLHANEQVSRMFLPLSFSTDTTVFIIAVGTRVDTLWFKHQSEHYFISRECGLTWNFNIDSAWFAGTIIDSVYTGNPNVNYGENIENIRIFIR